MLCSVLRQRIFYPLKFLVVAAAVWRQNLDQLKFSAAGDGATSFRQSITVPFSGRPFPKRGMISMTTKFVAGFYATQSQPLTVRKKWLARRVHRARLPMHTHKSTTY